MAPSARWTMRPIMSGEGGVDKIVARRAAAPAFALVGAGEPAIADDVGDQDRRELPCLAHFERPSPRAPVGRRVEQNILALSQQRPGKCYARRERGPDVCIANRFILRRARFAPSSATAVRMAK
jgi:hypothetical protein